MVDDEQVVHALLGRALAGSGLRLRSAFDGEAGLALARSLRPDLIVLDLGLPGRGGSHVLRELRRAPETEAIPVMILTGDGARESKTRELWGGADDYIVKPFDVFEVAARITNLLGRRARDLSTSPLTGLPGNSTLHAETRRRLETGEAFDLVYADIDRFKAFNDRYGYARGDRAITAAADVLRRAVGAGGFLAHIGGDDFAALCRHGAGEAAAASAARAFDAAAPLLYDREDRERGWTATRDRRGILLRRPLMALSIAVVPASPGEFAHEGALSDAAAEIKRHLKSRDGAGSAYLRERRGRSKEGEG